MLKKTLTFILTVILLIPAVFSSEPVRAADDSVITTLSIIIVCGDGFKSVDETCDKGDTTQGWPADFGTSTCADYEWGVGQYYNAGYLVCSDDCSQILTNMCSYCINGIMEGLEECDTSDFGGRTCNTFGYSEGNLRCTSQCRLDLSECSGVTNELGGTSGGNSGAPGGGSAIPSGFNPGSDTPQQETKVSIQGKAYPGAEVHILLDGKIVGIVNAGSDGSYSFETKDVTPGVGSFSFWAEDANKTKSVTITVTFRIISSANTTITGAFLPPTIVMDKTTVKKGDTINFSGQTVPEAQVFVHINSNEEIVKEAASLKNGAWSLPFDTSVLEDNAYHTAKALFQIAGSDGDQIKSGYGQTLNFFLGDENSKSKCEGADLNGDNRVNLTDFSILLYYWGTDNDCADQNANGKVDLVDFSIMMFNWTG